MTVIDAKHQFLKRRNYVIAALMAKYDADSSVLDYDIDYCGNEIEERYEVVVKYNTPIDFIELDYVIVTSDY